MERKPTDVQYTPQGDLRLLGALVKVLLIVMILGISIIVAIIVKEFFFDTKNKTTRIIAPESLSIPKRSRVEAIYLDDRRIYLLVNSRNKKQEILIVELEDGMEISRKSVKLVTAD